MREDKPDSFNRVKARWIVDVTGEVGGEDKPDSFNRVKARWIVGVTSDRRSLWEVGGEDKHT